MNIKEVIFWQTTINTITMTIDSHEHIQKSQVTIITRATNIETETRTTTTITWLNVDFQYDKTTDYATNDKVTIGGMTDVCQHCNAQKWGGGGGGGSHQHSVLQWKNESSTHLGAPLILKRLLEENTATSKHFRSNINKHNCAYQMISLE